MSNKSHKRFQWIGTEKEILRKLAQGSELVETSASIP
jgi:hypothetical protein